VRGLALALVVLAGGCSAVPLGPVEKPEPYPDRRTTESTWSTYIWAVQAGDLEVLEKTTGGVAREELDLQVKRNGREATSAWYARSGALRVEEAEWLDEGKATARLRAVLASETIERAEAVFFFGKNEASRTWFVFKRDVSQ
jgi:hypothetical protein